MSKPRIVGVVNDKGGSCKTTSTMAVATALYRMGKRVVIVDADDMNTMSDWRNKTPDGIDLPPVITLDKPELLASGLKAIDADVIFIDAPPKSSLMAAKVIGLADTVIIPMQPSPADTWALVATAKLVQTKLELGGKVDPVFLVTRAKTNTALAKYVLGGDWNEYGFPIMENAIPDRIVFQELLPSGTSIFETKEKDLQNDINKVAAELMQRGLV